MKPHTLFNGNMQNTEQKFDQELFRDHWGAQVITLPQELVDRLNRIESLCEEICRAIFCNTKEIEKKPSNNLAFSIIASELKKIKKSKCELRRGDIIKFYMEGMSSTEISKKIGVHRSNVARFIQKAKKEGFIKGDQDAVQI